MEKRENLTSYLWILSLLALPVSSLPNRLLLGMLLIWFLTRHRSGSLAIPYFKLFASTAFTLLILSAFTNKVLSKELILGLSIPAQGLFLIIVRPGSKKFKQGFHAALISIILLLVISKLGSVAEMGLSAYFSQEQWWNLWHYKNFTQALSLHPTYLSMFLLTGVLMLLFGTEPPTLKNEPRSADMTLFAFYLLSLWLISSKIALITLALFVLIFTAQKLTFTSKRRLLAMGSLIGLTILPPLVSPSIRHRLTHELENALQELPTDVPNRFSERRALWKSAFIEMDRHPILGTSLRGVKSREAIYPKAKFFYKPLEIPMNAHNNFIELGLRYGIVCGILLFVSSIFGLYRACRKRSLELIGFALVCIIFSMTESFLFREQGLSLAALMLLFYYLKENERII